MCLYFVIYSLFCIFAIERLRSCSRSDIDASIMFLAKPQFCAENIYILTKASNYYEQTYAMGARRHLDLRRNNVHLM